jgi:mRNA-degrading endonuclease toxin of MazEF toxin-antitoxin module
MINFLFADQRGWKRRPALVLSVDAYDAGRREVVLAALTSNVQRRLPGDTLLRDWEAASLPRPSIVAAILRTVKSGEVLHILGSLTPGDLRAVERNLRTVLAL